MALYAVVVLLRMQYRGARRIFCREVQPMTHSSNFLVTVHI